MPTTTDPRKDAPPEVTAEKARGAFGELLDRALRGKTTVITRNGRPVAQIIPIEDEAVA